MTQVLLGALGYDDKGMLGVLFTKKMWLYRYEMIECRIEEEEKSSQTIDVVGWAEMGAEALHQAHLNIVWRCHHYRALARPSHNVAIGCRSFLTSGRRCSPPERWASLDVSVILGVGAPLPQCWARTVGFSSLLHVNEISPIHFLKPPCPFLVFFVIW